MSRCQLCHEDREEPRLHLRAVRFFDDRHERRRRGGDVYDLDPSEPGDYSPKGLWVVDSLVTEISPTDLVSRKRGESDDALAKRAAALRFRRFRFDWEAAQRHVVSLSSRMSVSASWTLIPRHEQALEDDVDAELTSPQSVGSAQDSETGRPSPWELELASAVSEMACAIPAPPSATGSTLAGSS